MLDWNQCSAVERLAGKVSGAWVFKGTRVPVVALFENIESGAGGRFFAVVSGSSAGTGRGGIHPRRVQFDRSVTPRKCGNPKIRHPAQAA